ncbi:hypothetical protein B0I71DRAFT_132072 [Yarrowia lipolytica]|uniref:Uncharacterized protein n=1 Tax=Yarrowia lipolytica TaxID=4952 RepID=A0A371C5Y3_YARLL|nr:hypothetical protein B0I71DRAFT_132072 [Yarrowia lipolytica]
MVSLIAFLSFSRSASQTFPLNLFSESVLEGEGERLVAILAAIRADFLSHPRPCTFQHRSPFAQIALWKVDPCPCNSDLLGITSTLFNSGDVENTVGINVEGDLN